MLAQRHRRWPNIIQTYWLGADLKDTHLVESISIRID